MLEKAELNIEKISQHVLVDPDYVDIMENSKEESFNFKMRRMAAEIILTFLNDVLSIKKIRKYVNIISDRISSTQKKTEATLIIDRHVKAVRWFCNGIEGKSVWFELLGYGNIKKKELMDIVHKRIEKER